MNHGTRLNSFTGRLLVLAGIVLVFMMFAESATSATRATVVLHDGRIVTGTFLGGTEQMVKLSQGAEILEIPVKEITSISMGDPAEAVLKDTAQSPPNAVTSEFSGVVVPAATSITVKLGQPLSTVGSKVGSTFMAIVAEDVLVAEVTVIRKGLAVVGRVAGVQPGGRIRGDARLSLVLDSLHFPSGSQPLKTRVWIEPGIGDNGADSTGSRFLTPDQQISLPVGTELEFILVQPVPIPEK